MDWLQDWSARLLKQRAGRNRKEQHWRANHDAGGLHCGRFRLERVTVNALERRATVNAEVPRARTATSAGPAAICTLSTEEQVVVQPLRDGRRNLQAGRSTGREANSLELLLE